jgi:hypothetical protein
VSEAPRAVREAALAAFDARRPGTSVLDLARDLPVTTTVGEPARPPYRELRFGQEGAPAVTVEVHGADDELMLKIRIDWARSEDYRLEVSGVSGLGLPVVKGKPPFEVSGVLPGLTSLLLSTGVAGSPDEQRWQTAWVRL